MTEIQEPITSEAEGWRLVAEQYALRTPGSYAIPAQGLCSMLDTAWTKNQIAGATRQRMCARLEAHRRAHSPTEWEGGYVYEGYEHSSWEFQDARVLACLWMALEAEEEERA